MIPVGNHSLGGVALPRGTRWINRENYQRIGQRLFRPLAGGIHSYERPISARPIELSIQRPYSWITSTQLASLAALATVGNQLAFVWHPDDEVAENYTVILAHEAGAFELSHIDSIGGYGRIDRGLYEGIIRLITV